MLFVSQACQQMRYLIRQEKQKYGKNSIKILEIQHDVVTVSCKGEMYATIWLINTSTKTVISDIPYNCKVRKHTPTNISLPNKLRVTPLLRIAHCQQNDF